MARLRSGLKNPNDLYVGMLKSRTVADNLIQRFDLNKLYEQKFQSETRRRLARETTVSSPERTASSRLKWTTRIRSVQPSWRTATWTSCSS